MTRLRYGGFALALCITSCVARDSPENWKAECVGRMQLNLPGAVDVAATTRSDLRKGWNPPSSSFVDGEYAGWSGLEYRGSVEVVHGLDASGAEAFWSERATARETFRTKYGKSNGPARYRDLPPLSRPGIAFEAQGQRYLTVGLRQHVFVWSGYSGIARTEARAAYDAVASGLRARDIFFVPSEAGVCFPYAFIQDDGRVRRHIATTYRLQEHPDVTILLRDVSAVEVDPNANQDVYDPEAQSDSFWGRYDGVYRRSLRSVWRDPYKRIKLGDSKGVESFVRIVREDGSEDFGYLVVARGDPHAKKDTPDLMLYVIQNSAKARAKGIEPMSKKAFLELAQTIAASVKRRPVTAR